MYILWISWHSYKYDVNALHMVDVNTLSSVWWLQNPKPKPKKNNFRLTNLMMCVYEPKSIHFFSFTFRYLLRFVGLDMVTSFELYSYYQKWALFLLNTCHKEKPSIWHFQQNKLLCICLLAMWWHIMLCIMH